MERTLPALRPRALPDVRVGLLAVVAVSMLLPGLILGPNADAGVFLTVGDGLTRGQLPYIDLWDHKPPGIYLAHALGVILPGDPWLGVWLLSLAALLGTAYLLLPLAGTWATLLAITAAASFPAAQGGGMTETFATLAGLGAVTLALRERPALAGLAAAAAVLTSLQLLAVLPALLVLTPARAWWKGIIAFAAPVAIVLPFMWDSVIVYSTVYVGLDKGEDFATYLAPSLLLVAPLTLLLGRPRNRLGWAAAAWLGFGLVLVTTNGRFFPHYFAPLLIPLALLARVERRPWWLPAGLLAAALIVGGVVETLRILPSHVGPDARAVAGWLRANTEPDDQVLSWGFQPAAVALADRETAGRYPYFLPLTTPGYSTPAMVAEWVASLEADPPAVIVDMRPPFAVPRPGAGGGRDLNIVQPFRDWVTAHYRQVDQVAGRPIYVRTRLP